MAVIAGTEFWRDEIHQLPACLAVLDQVLKNQRAFAVEFRGVTASPDAVMIQGFPADDSLSRLRDELRDAFGRTASTKNWIAVTKRDGAFDGDAFCEPGRIGNSASTFSRRTGKPILAKHASHRCN